MKSQGQGYNKATKASLKLRFVAVLTICLGAMTGIGRAKEAGLTAIEIYNGPSGASYVQLTNVLISAKIEMRVTASADAAMEKGFYNKLNKLTMEVGGVLERGTDGVLRYTGADGQTVVVVPWNAKFEHGAALTPAQLADQAVLRGTAVGSGQPQQLGRGVKLVFVAAPDQEYAEYLRAERASEIEGWRAYLAKYPSSRHLGDAKSRLAALYAQAGESALEQYSKTADSASPAYESLKSARSFVEQATALAPGLPAVKQLDDRVLAAVSAIVEKGRNELDAYLKALKERTAGYAHLGTAKSLLETANGIEATQNGETALNEEMKAYDAVQSAMRQAESSVTAKKYDLALSNVEPYRSFASEEPRISAVIDADYNYHMDAGKRAGLASSWDAAVAEFEKAEKAKGTPEERRQLANAREQWTITQDKAAAQKALAESAGYEQEKPPDIIRAYEVLDQLPDSQKKLVADDLQRLQPAYIQKCAQTAKGLNQAYKGLGGVADEKGVEQAYSYYSKAYKLSEDPGYKDQMDAIADELSGYELAQAKRYTAKPDGSGTEMAWTYLSEAFRYRASNQSDVRDAMTAAAPRHRIRSNLSIRVQFRDQTGGGSGFATQVENAVIAGLEKSRIPMKVVRENEPTADLVTDYLIEGDVLRHQLTPETTKEPVPSTFLSGTEQVESESWLKANQAVEKAQIEVTAAQNKLTVAEGKGKKHEIEAAQRSVQDATKAVNLATAARDSMPKMVTRPVSLPYTYIKQTVTLTGSIEMEFRISDPTLTERVNMEPIDKDETQSYTVLLNVKPEDPTANKDLGTPIDQTQFLRGVENDALTALVTAVRGQVEKLPQKIYSKGMQRESEQDLEGAGEAYIRYLELMPNDDSAAAKHARQFLLDKFNMSPESIVAIP
jgi:hypothetical protein